MLPVDHATSEAVTATTQTQPTKRKARSQAPVKAAPPPAKRVKRSSARSSALVQSQKNAEDVISQVQDGQTIPGDDTANAAPAVAEPAPLAQPKARKRKSGNVSTPSVAGPRAEPGNEPEPTPAPSKSRKRRKTPSQPRKTPSKPAGRRSKTPVPTHTAVEDGRGVAEEDHEEEGAASVAEEEQEADGGSDAELHEIDPNKVTMFGLSYDKKHGKTSERERKMAEIDWDEVARKRRDDMERAAEAAAAGSVNQSAQPTDVRETTEVDDGTVEPAPDTEPEVAAPTGDDDGIGFRIVDGQIVTDETNLVIDRQAIVEEEAAQNTVPVVEDNDLTRRINQMSWINARRRDIADRVAPARGKSDPWSEEETERFYEALRMFGTDFYLISKMFAPKSRKMIKMKFIREERLDLQRVNAALMGKQTGPTYDLEFYARETGREMSEFTKYDNVEHADRVIRESMKEKEAALNEAIREEEDREEATKQAQAVREKNRKKAADDRAVKRKEKDGAASSKGKGRKRKEPVFEAADDGGNGGDA